LIWDQFKPWYQSLVEKVLQEKSRLDSERADGNGVRTDGLFDSLFDSARSDWSTKAQSKQADLHNLGMSVDLHARMGLQSQVDAAASFDPEKAKIVPGITPPKLAELDDFVSENVRLVRKIGDEAADRLQRLAIDAHKNGTSNAQLARDIKKEFEYHESRANLIAADQIGKINSDLTRINHESIGIVGYFWSISGAPNVRPAHQVRNGVYFAYSDPPSDGHAGKPVRCRCTQRPDIFGEGPAQKKAQAESKPGPEVSAKPKQPKQSKKTPPTLPPVKGGGAPPASGGNGNKPPKKPKSSSPNSDFNLDAEREKINRMRQLVENAQFTATEPLKNYNHRDLEKICRELHKLSVPGFQNLVSTIKKKSLGLIKVGARSRLQDFASQTGDLMGHLFELEGAYKVHDIMDLRAIGVRANRQPGDIDLLAVDDYHILLIELKNGEVDKDDILLKTIPQNFQIYHQEGKLHIPHNDRNKPLKLVVIAQNALKLNDIAKAGFISDIEKTYDFGLLLNNIDDLKAE
jgi:SPP1 gp7 family putative phage head morphogenesis protein